MRRLFWGAGGERSVRFGNQTPPKHEFSHFFPGEGEIARDPPSTPSPSLNPQACSIVRATKFNKLASTNQGVSTQLKYVLKGFVVQISSRARLALRVFQSSIQRLSSLRICYCHCINRRYVCRQKRPQTSTTVGQTTDITCYFGKRIKAIYEQAEAGSEKGTCEQWTVVQRLGKLTRNRL